MWSKIGDVAWTLGFREIADLAYTQAFKQAEREFVDTVSVPLSAGLMLCRHPECLWEAKVTRSDENDPQTMMELYHAYATHPCPITEEMLIDMDDEDDE